MQDAWFTAAVTLVMSGVAPIEDVDRAWIGVTRMPIGPFGVMDAIGLDTILMNPAETGWRDTIAPTV